MLYEMKKILLLSLTFSLFTNQGKSQQINPVVLAGSGAHFSNGNSQLSWTLGESVIETFSGGLAQSFYLTQGFHQPNLAFSSIDNSISKPDISIYPNPASSILFVDYKSSNEEYQIEIRDCLGRVVINEAKPKEEKIQSIHLDGLARGSYLIKIYSNQIQNKLIRHFVISN